MQKINKFFIELKKLLILFLLFIYLFIFFFDFALKLYYMTTK